MRSIFGWSLPPGCGQLPGEGPERVRLRCATCGAFLRDRPDRTQPWEQFTRCNGTVSEVDPDTGECYSACGYVGGAHAPHRVFHAAGVHEYRTCTRCGAENRETIV